MATPTSNNKTITLNEDTTRVFLLADFDFLDVDISDTLSKVKIVSIPLYGSMTLNGASVVPGLVINVADITSGLLTYTPDANDNGSPYTSFVFQVSDGVNYSINYTMTINVTAVNDVPTASDYELSIVIVSGDIYAGVLPYAVDNDGQAVTYSLATAPMVGATAVVTTGGMFTYTPKANVVGQDKFSYSITDGTATNTYNVLITIISTSTTSVDFAVPTTPTISTIAIESTDITSISTYPISVADAREIVLAGTGVFDDFMTAINAHLALQFFENRLKGPDYATVYLGAMQTALAQSTQFVLQKVMAEKQAEGETARTLLTAKQVVTESAKAAATAKQVAGEDARTKVTLQQVISESAKTSLIARQTKGFDDDAKQKLMKQMLDSWAIAYSVAQDANSIPDTIKVNPIDNVTKSAMVGLGIMTADQDYLPNNPLGENGVSPTPIGITTYFDTSLGVFTSSSTSTDTTPGFNVGVGSTSVFKLYIGGVPVLATYSSTLGTLTPNVPLSVGLHLVTYTITVGTDAESSQSSSFSLTIS